MSFRYTPDHMYKLPVLIDFQHQNRGTLGIFRVDLNEDTLFHQGLFVADPLFPYSMKRVITNVASTAITNRATAVIT